jgi:hypothetical protein
MCSMIFDTSGRASVVEECLRHQTRGALEAEHGLPSRRGRFTPRATADRRSQPPAARGAPDRARRVAHHAAASSAPVPGCQSSRPRRRSRHPGCRRSVSGVGSLRGRHDRPRAAVRDRDQRAVRVHPPPDVSRLDGHPGRARPVAKQWLVGDRLAPARGRNRSRRPRRRATTGRALWRGLRRLRSTRPAISVDLWLGSPAYWPSLPGHPAPSGPQSTHQLSLTRHGVANSVPRAVSLGRLGVSRGGGPGGPTPCGRRQRSRPSHTPSPAVAGV